MIDNNDSFWLWQTLIKDLLVQPLAPNALEKACAAGRLPHGDPGRLSFQSVCSETEDMVATMPPWPSGPWPAAFPVQARIAPYTITGALENVLPAGQLCYRYSNTKGSDIIGAWLRHLLWCRMADVSEPCVTMMINRDGRRRFRKVDDPDAQLAHLLSIYYRAGHEPVPFFPRSSWAYAVLRFEKAYPVEKALDRVRTQWNQSFQWPGEGEDPYIEYCFRTSEPLGQAFVEITEATYHPIMQCAERF